MAYVRLTRSLRGAYLGVGKTQNHTARNGCTLCWVAFFYGVAVATGIDVEVGLGLGAGVSKY